MIDVHASYYFDSETFDNFTNHEIQRLTQAREQYKRQKATQVLASLDARESYTPTLYSHSNYNMQALQQYVTSIVLPPLPQNKYAPIPPPQPAPQSYISQMATPMQSTMMGDRNECAINSHRHHQQGGQCRRQQIIAPITLRRTMISESSRG